MQLTPTESTALDACENTIRAGLDAFQTVGAALLTIRDTRLYRAEFPTFEEYCRTRWGMSKTHVNRNIAAAAVLENLTPIGVKPENEAQARPLAQLEPEAQREAWQEACAETNGKPTAKAVQRAVAARKAKDPLDELKKLKLPEPEPDYSEAQPIIDVFNGASKAARFLFVRWMKDEGLL